MAGVALGEVHLHFAWQAWHLVTSTVTLRGRRGTYGIGLALVARLVLGVTPWRRGVLVAGVALGDIHLHFAWQAWRLVTSTVTLRGRRGTYGTGLALVARLVLGVTPWRCGVLRGRRGAWRGAPSLCVVGVALGDIHRHFAWQAWHLWHWAGSSGALGFRCDAVAPRRFAWQAWHLATCTFTLRGRRGTYDLWHWSGSGGALGFRCDAVAPRCFAWQAWHLATSTFTLRGRRGAW